VFVVELAGVQAVVELAEELVEQVPLGLVVPISSGAAGVVVAACARSLAVGDPRSRTVKGILVAGTEHGGSSPAPATHGWSRRRHQPPRTPRSTRLLAFPPGRASDHDAGIQHRCPYASDITALPRRLDCWLEPVRRRLG
jgi:hypothetical protein